jgi:uncharacterized surface protein with fasciclin (FAS1) repeats
MEQTKNTAAHASAGSTRTPPTMNLVDTAVAAGNFTTLIAGLKAAGLVETLSGKGPFTVFAPTDEAFKKLPAGALDALLKDAAKLKAVLSYHVVAKHVDAKDVTSGEVMTVQGTTLTALVDTAGVHVNGAKVVKADIEATNGVIHVIDAVIMPKHWQLLASAA